MIRRGNLSVQLKVLAFIVVSLGIAWISRASLREVRSHGFSRFFGWEATLALILINIDHWLVEPFRLLQVVSWSLLIVSGYFGIHGLVSLCRLGKSDSLRREPTLLSIEKTTELVTGGAYRFIRHPLYSSLLFLSWGALFKHVSWLRVCLATMATLFLVMTAKREEAENARFFGDAYRWYKQQTKMLIPFVL